MNIYVEPHVHFDHMSVGQNPARYQWKPKKSLD